MCYRLFSPGHDSVVKTNVLGNINFDNSLNFMWINRGKIGINTFPCSREQESWFFMLLTPYAWMRVEQTERAKTAVPVTRDPYNCNRCIYIYSYKFGKRMLIVIIIYNDIITCYTLSISYILCKIGINNIMCTRNTQNYDYRHRYLKMYNTFLYYYIRHIHKMKKYIATYFKIVYSHTDILRHISKVKRKSFSEN